MINFSVCKETEDVYTDAFLAGFDVVMCALDSVESRLYLDSRCVSATKPFIDTGTVGLKGW